MKPNTCIIAVGLLAVVTLATAATVRNTRLDDFKCKDNSDYVTYDPSSCDKYIECKNGQAEHKSCGWFYRFDETSNQCIFHLWLIGNPDCSKVNPVSPTTSPTGSPNSPTPTPSDNGSTVPTTKKTNAAPVNSFSLTLGVFFLGALCFLS